jgi:hypothetical protein
MPKNGGGGGEGTLMYGDKFISNTCEKQKFLALHSVKIENKAFLNIYGNE